MRLAATLAAAALLAGCAPAAPPREPPARPTIVSLDPCADAILAEVTAPGQLLAVSHYSHDPQASSMGVAAARRFPATGGTVEEIVALGPQVVVGTTFTPPATRQALARLGVPLVELGIAASVEASEDQVRWLAAVAGNRAGGEALVARIDAALAAAAPPLGTAPVEALVWQAGGLVPGDATLIADLLARTGFRNAAAARGLGQGALLGLEAVLADPPRVILAAGNGHGGADRMLDHPALEGLAPGTLRAPLPSQLLWCGGPTIPRAAAHLAAVRRRVEGLDRPTPNPSRTREGDETALLPSRAREGPGVGLASLSTRSP